MEFFFTQINYIASIILMMVGLYGVIACNNLIKKLISLSIFQTSVLLLYIAAGYVKGGAIPLLTEKASIYVNPLPHVLMLTAIVVGISTIAVGLAIAARIKRSYGTIEENELIESDLEEDRNEVDDKDFSRDFVE